MNSVSEIRSLNSSRERRKELIGKLKPGTESKKDDICEEVRKAINSAPYQDAETEELDNMFSKRKGHTTGTVYDFDKEEH